MKKAFLIISTAIQIAYTQTQQLLQSGPMLGYSEMREVLLWVQTTRAAEVQARYFSTIPGSTRYVTNKVFTTVENAFVAKLLADMVAPGTVYNYELFINGKPITLPYPCYFKTKPHWAHSNNAPDLTFALGSCTYINDTVFDRPGFSYGGNYEIFNSIASKKPDLMLWLGDNVYLRDADWDTRTGIYYRYTQTRKTPQLQELLASTHHYALWDDHDFGPNDSDRSFYNKDVSLEAFNLFWGNKNAGNASAKGIFNRFTWSDCEFYLLDNRYYRTPFGQIKRDTMNATFLGNDQLEWLLDGLSSSKATFKFICVGSQVLNPAKWNKEGFAYAPHDLQKITQAIREQSISGVMFLSGDRHFSELTYLSNDVPYKLYDFTVSPLTSGAFCAQPQEMTSNHPRIEGSLLCNQRNFGIIEVGGNKETRNLRLVLYDSNGTERFSKTLLASELK